MNTSTKSTLIYTRYLQHICNSYEDSRALCNVQQLFVHNRLQGMSWKMCFTNQSQLEQFCQKYFTVNLSSATVHLTRFTQIDPVCKATECKRLPVLLQYRHESPSASRQQTRQHEIHCSQSENASKLNDDKLLTFKLFDLLVKIITKVFMSVNLD